MKKRLNFFTIAKLVIVVVLVNVVFTQQVLAQAAPDCEECNDLIDEPLDYVQCVEEHCNDAIPIDNNLWLLIVGGVGMGAYAFYKYGSLEVKHVN